jgi:GNAT superfamily N-acetyltransferase
MTVATRPATTEDLPGVLALARRALGWSDVSPRFLEWKHIENPWGRSFMWVALDGDRVIAFRAFLRWELVDADGRCVVAARAVDTATDPEHRRQGLFRSLTTAALDEMAAAGVQLVWNTPNSSSLPGYLTMGWQEVGRLPAVVRPAAARFPFVVLTARRPAARDAVATHFGRAAWEVFGHDPDVDALLAALPASAGLATRRTQGFLAWRYNNPALGYRVLALGDSPADGLAVFRLRRRGRAVEATVCDLLCPEAAGGPNGATASGLVRRIARGTDADYVLSLASPSRATVTRPPVVRLSQIGPVLACRPLDGTVPPAVDGWALTMGDVELL